MARTKVKLERGVYAIGGYVAFRVDEPSTGEWDEAPRDVTWGIVHAETYARDPQVGLPDAITETRTLSDALAWVQRQAALREGTDSATSVRTS